MEPQMDADNFAGSENWTVERSDAGPSASEGERQGWREHKHGFRKFAVSFYQCSSVFIGGFAFNSQ
jgi:hypothetical protein